jgi:hypothetical protein
MNRTGHENYDQLWKMKAIFDKLSDSYATHNSLTKLSAVGEIIVLFKGIESCSNSIYQRNTSDLG